MLVRCNGMLDGRHLGREADEVAVAVFDDELPKTPRAIFRFSDDLYATISIDVEQAIQVGSDVKPQIDRGIGRGIRFEGLETNVNCRR